MSYNSQTNNVGGGNNQCFKQGALGEGTTFNAQWQNFPTIGGSNQNQQQQQTGIDSGANAGALSNPFGSASFKIEAKEFVFSIPGAIGAVDEFPDTGFVPQPKKKKVTQEEIEAKKKAEADALPTKGKPTMFFYVQPDFYGQPGQPSQDQTIFVYTHYPQYSQNPVQILDWLYAQGYATDQALLQQAMEQQAYQAPGSNQNRKNNNNYSDSGEDDYSNNYEETQETNFGYSNNKKKNAGQKKPQEAVKKVIKAKDPEKVAKAEEVKKAKVIKDVVVKVDSENIVNVNTDKQPCSLVFIGHVDAGKSTISGQIMLLMGMVDERTIIKYKQEAKEKGRDSWWLAYCMDVGEEEKAKGKTVEVGRATFATASKEFTIFDAPGHKNYVPNMIMGAALADYGGLVISARKGEYEAGFEKEGQTREHVQLAKSLGVQKLVVVVNKMDDPSVNWSEARWNEIRTNLSPFLIKSGYAEGDFSFVPMSGLTGENIKEPVDAKTCSWYSGPTLIQALDGLPNEKRNPSGPLRIPVLDKTLDQGVIAHGKIESGTLNIGDKIQLWPSGYPAQVGSILDHKNAQVMYARPGENVQIKLIHIEDEKMIQKGDVICGRENPIPVTMLFEAELDILELLDYKPIMSKGYTCIMHCHTFADDCVIKDILQAIEFDEKAQGLVTKMAPKFTKSFAKCHVRITTKYPIALEKYETIASLGRFTLRDEGKTIAIGRVTKYKPHKVDSGIVVSGATQVTGQVDPPKVTETKPDKNATLVFDMETGTTSVAEKKMEAIAEGDSGEDN